MFQSYYKKTIQKQSLIKLGAAAEFVEQSELPFSTMGLVKLKDQAQFNPLKFISEIAKELNIYEHTMIMDIDGHCAVSEEARITANQIIVATHFPFINKHGSYFIKMYQRRSYVIAVEGAPEYQGMYVDESLTGMSFRTYKDLLLIGGGDHRTGKQGGNWKELRTFQKKYYPNSNEKYFWATQDCMSLDHIPYIGQYSKHTPNLFVATGFNQWGMTTSFAAAMILCDLVQGKTNEYQSVFNPSRSMVKPQLFVNGFESATNLLTPGAKRCPHLGCKLKRNKAEHTWDCPCHGSRFENEGRLLDNPAMKDANIN